MATARALLIRIWCTLLFRATSRRDPDGRQFVRKPTGTCPAAGTKRAGPSGPLNATDQPQGVLRVSIRHFGDGLSIVTGHSETGKVRSQGLGPWMVDDGLTMTKSPDRAVLLDPDAGRHLWTMGMLMTVKASADETGNTCSAMEVTFPPNVGPPMHIHRREAELNYVLKGAMKFRCGDDELDCGAGGFV